MMDRDAVADEAGREHTGGLGEREGAGSTGGAPTDAEAEAPRGGDPDEDPAMYEPTREERQGLGDVGRHAQSTSGDAADVGERERTR